MSARHGDRSDTVPPVEHRSDPSFSDQRVAQADEHQRRNLEFLEPIEHRKVAGAHLRQRRDDWAIDPSHAIWLLVAVFIIRALGPATAIGGDGVGGLFTPLTAAGAVIGRIFADAVDPGETALHVTVGAACMFGGGCAAPLTGVVFVAEYAGQASVIMPALVAMTLTRLVVRDRSVSPHQVS